MICKHYIIIFVIFTYGCSVPYYEELQATRKTLKELEQTYAEAKDTAEAEIKKVKLAAEREVRNAEAAAEKARQDLKVEQNAVKRLYQE